MTGRGYVESAMRESAGGRSSLSLFATSPRVALLAAMISLNVPARGAVSDKVDDGIAGGTTRHAVFVRLADQLLDGQGDYERFCRENAGARRASFGRRSSDPP